MNYEQKYKEALGWMQSLYGGLHGVTKEDAEHYFPELKESEDERVIQYFKDLAPFDKADELYKKYGFSHKDAIAWLEKQADKAVNIDIESMISSYKQRLKSQGDIENTPLFDMCLTAFRHGVENVLEELNLKKLDPDKVIE